MADKPLSQPPVSDADLDKIITHGAAEVERERNPNIRRFLDDSLTEWRAEKAKRARKPGKRAIKAALDWQRP